MFKKNKRTKETILVVFVTIVLLILVAGLALFWVNGENNKITTNQTNNKNQTTQDDNTVSLTQKKSQVLSNYKTEIDSQRKELKKFSSNQAMIKDTQQFFLNTKVPKKYLDSHFQAFLEFKNKKQAISDKISSEARSHIENILSNITQ